MIPLIQHYSQFPNPSFADEDGLLAFGGELTDEWLLSAYSKGLFPWFNEGDPVLWWCPDPRMVLKPKDFKRSKSFRNVLNRGELDVTFDRAFLDVIKACKETPRFGQEGTWITSDVEAAYIHMHELGWAHSVEVWKDDKLVGGLYGLAMGKIFFGESMFSHVSNASKIALYELCQRCISLGVELIDCQVYTEHLESLGAKPIDRTEFLEELNRLYTLKKVNFNG